ncbi:MAG: HEAT repeat domain-containing protein [Planctomycetaceae bacterium]
MATTLSFVRAQCRFRILNSIRFELLFSDLAPDAFDALIGAWDKRTLEIWDGSSGRPLWGDCSRVFASDWGRGPSAAGFHYIQVHGGDPFSAQTWFGPPSTSGVWHDTETTGEVAAHEVGHLMGLGEEYTNAGGVYVNTNPQPDGMPQSIMAQTWGEVAALPEHFDTILAWFGAKCPERCRWTLVEVLRVTLLPELLLRRFPPSRVPVIRPGVPPDPFPPPPPPPNPLEGEAMEKLFAAIETGRPQVMAQAMDALVRRGAAAVPDLLGNLGHTHPLRRWACATVLGRIADREATAGLRGALQDPHGAVRLAAAVSLLQLRDTSGIPILLDALHSEEVMLGSPPRLAREHAHIALRHWTGRDFGFDSNAGPRVRRAAAQSWESWWDAEGAHFTLP